MIRRSFVFLPSVGKTTERRIWSRGATTWSEFLSASTIPGFSRKRKEDLDIRLNEAEDFLNQERAEYFCGLLPSTEQWRLFDELKQGAAYLDIESDGIGPGHVVTMVGILRNGKMTTLVRGQGLDQTAIKDALDGVKMLVTFNGSSFDLPMIEHEFPFSVPRVPHYDLRHVCPKAGYHGGLKSVEQQIGISRPQEVEYVTGEQAVYLWHLWSRKGNQNALNLLTRYNAEDVKNMEPLADLVYDIMKEKMMRDINAGYERRT
ncbi:MAG TPA: ribonuclease H-like domain-containing protein [Methanomassiliicoccales archaeon]|jgi:hypothetical protein